MTPQILNVKFQAIDHVSSKLKAMQNSVSSFANKAGKTWSNAGKNAFAASKKFALAAAFVLAPLALMAKQAVQFEDRMSDVGKTTGMQGKELTKFGDDILDLSTKTRSSIEDLSTIAEIGGRLAVPKKELKAFTVEANKFAVALGGDFSGGVESAVTEFSKIKGLFKDTKDLDISTALRKSGSAFNSLSAKGVNVEGLTDFSLRVGALPEVFRPSLASSAALGATLQKSGVDAQIASSGFSNFITNAAANLPQFSKEMGITTQQAKDLINSDTAGFFAKFAEKMKGVPASELAVKLKGLKLNSLEVQKAVGAMSGATETYSELLAISNKQMALGTSIGEEYNTKNNNTAGQMARLKNQVQALAIKMGQALLPVINNVVESVSPFLKGMSDWISRNKGLVGTIAKVALTIGILAGSISGLLAVWGTFQKVGAAASIVMKAFGASTSMALGPLGLIVTAIGAVAVAVGMYVSANDTYRTSAQLTNEVNKEALSRSIDQRVELQRNFDTLRKAKQGTNEYRGALAEIERIQPGITEKYNLQTKSLKALNAAEKESIALIMARTKAEIAREKAKEKLVKAQELRDEGVGFFDQLASFGANQIRMNPFVAKDDRFKGAPLTAEQYKAIQIINLENQAKDLYGKASGFENQATDMQVANPDATKAFNKGSSESVVTIDFQNMPAGVEATATKKGKGGKVPVLKNTR